MYSHTHTGYRPGRHLCQPAKKAHIASVIISEGAHNSVHTREECKNKELFSRTNTQGVFTLTAILSADTSCWMKWNLTTTSNQELHLFPRSLLTAHWARLCVHMYVCVHSCAYLTRFGTTEMCHYRHGCFKNALEKQTSSKTAWCACGVGLQVPAPMLVLRSWELFNMPIQKLLENHNTQPRQECKLGVPSLSVWWLDDLFVASDELRADHNKLQA